MRITKLALALTLAAAPTVGCSTRECTNYNDCPQNSICTQGGICDVIQVCQDEGPEPFGGTQYGGVNFPAGAVSFADAAVSYELNDGTECSNNDLDTVLGPPVNLDLAPGTFACLGNGLDGEVPGEMIVQFTDNVLADLAGDDLFIFEVGGAVEASDIAVSVNGFDWVELGRIEGATRGFDLASVSGTQGLQFSFVRVRDFPDGVTSGGGVGGPDIDAIGAIGAIVPGDEDIDGTLDVDDNCVDNHNPTQKDDDDDGVGNACDCCPSIAGANSNGCDWE